MRLQEIKETIICDRCGSGFRSWEDSIATGTIDLIHSSVAGDHFATGASIGELSDQRAYCRDHPALVKDEAQHLTIKYGGDNKYHLCWRCSYKLIEVLGGFFKRVPKST